MLNVIYSLIAIFICLGLGHATHFLIGGIPASLYGMLLFTVGLSTQIIAHQRLQATIQFIITNMGICFVPTAVGIVEYWYLMAEFGISITLIVMFTTLILLALVGFAYQKWVNTASDKYGQ